MAVPFPIEKASSKKITTTTVGVEVSEILNYPVRGLLFEGGTTLEDLSRVVSDSCICLQENNIPYNVLISDSGKRVFLLPQVRIVIVLPHYLLHTCKNKISFCYSIYSFRFG